MFPQWMVDIAQSKEGRATFVVVTLSGIVLIFVIVASPSDEQFSNILYMLGAIITAALSALALGKDEDGVPKYKALIGRVRSSGALWLRRR